MKVYGYPRYEVEFINGECYPFPEDFRSPETGMNIYRESPVLAHPDLPPVLLTESGWKEIKLTYDPAQERTDINVVGTYHAK